MAFATPVGGVYSDTEIKAALASGHIICDPAPAMINGSSIDVTLGYYFYRAGSQKTTNHLFNPFDEADVKRYFGVCNRARPWHEVRDELQATGLSGIQTVRGIPDDHPVIVLRPNERILAHTHEFIGIMPPGTTSMQARSTTGRIGISACYCAGWGDPGYVNRWTLEVHNLNENEHTILPVGYRIAQIVFSSTGPVETEYTQASGNYQSFNADQLDRIKHSWRPEQMLPKAYNNDIMLPVQVDGLGEGLR